MKRSSRLFAAILVALILAVATYAFAAANTVPTSGAGDGGAAISGYTVTNVHYALNATTPSNIDTLTFTLTPIGGASAATSVSVQLVTGGSWFGCTMAGNNATCTVTGVTALAADNLRVVAAQ